MKKSICLFIILTFFISGTSIAHATVSDMGTSIIVAVKESKKFTLNLSEVKFGIVSCEISTNKGVIVHNQKIDPQIVNSTVFNLENLKVGSYVITVEDNLLFQEINIVINENDLNVLPGSKVTYKPHFKILNNEFLDLNLFAKNKKARLKISDYDGEIYKESFEPRSTISKRYDISKLPKGDYVVELEYDGRYFYQEIKV